MADWYYAKDGRQQGPVTSAQLRQMAQGGELQPDDLVFKEGGTNWIPASSVQGLFPAGGVSTRAAPAPAPARGAEPQAFAFDSGGSGGAPDDGDPRPSRRSGGGGSFFLDLLLFRRMVAPTIILILYYLAAVGITLTMLVFAVLALTSNLPTGVKLGMALGYLISIPIAILVYRILAEMMIVIFRIYETLREIQKQQEKRGST
jgi:hypothetical protein